MIRLLIDKVKLLPTSSSIRNLSNVIKPSSVVFNKTRSFTTQVVSQTSPASLAKDVIVFQYENPRFFKLMNIFTISQFFFWGESIYKLKLIWILLSKVSSLQATLVIGHSRVFAMLQYLMKLRITTRYRGGKRSTWGKPNTRALYQRFASPLVSSSRLLLKTETHFCLHFQATSCSLSVGPTLSVP